MKQSKKTNQNLGARNRRITNNRTEVFVEKGERILPMLFGKNGAQECDIKITISDKSVTLKIGRRDWEWDRKTRKMVGAGTEVSPCIDTLGQVH